MTPMLSLRGAALALSALAATFAGPACLAQEETLPAQVAASAVPAAETPVGPALWKLADEDTTIYLFGTVHVLPEGVSWFEGPIEQAFASSGEMVTEVDTSDAAAIQGELASKAKLEGDRTLRELMGEEDRLAYEEAMVASGLPVGALDGFEPWYAALNLSLLPLMQQGYDPNSGVEAILTARAADKQRSELETVGYQIDLFDGLPLEQQIAYLRSTIDMIPRLKDTLDAMVAEWLEGDADQLAVLLNADMADKQLYDRLLVARNVKWAAWLDERMDRPGTVFVAVGAGHLAGEGSVQDQLEDRGFDVTRVH